MHEKAGVVVGRSFYAADSVEVAPRLLGKLLVRADGRAGRIIEVEAYRGGDDPGSHAFRGPTARNATMFGPPGHLYVYFTYGMHWCANVVCGEEGVARAVLLRALEPVAGLASMRAARTRRSLTKTSGATSTSSCPVDGVDLPICCSGSRSSTARLGRGERPAVERDLCRGPARLCQALGIDRAHDGADLVTAERGVWLADDGTPPPAVPEVTARVGLSAGADLPWRWLVAGHAGVSRPRTAAEPRAEPPEGARR